MGFFPSNLERKRKTKRKEGGVLYNFSKQGRRYRGLPLFVEQIRGGERKGSPPKLR